MIRFIVGREQAIFDRMLAPVARQSFHQRLAGAPGVSCLSQALDLELPLSFVRPGLGIDRLGYRLRGMVLE
jgi:hypothetical protein